MAKSKWKNKFINLNFFKLIFLNKFKSNKLSKIFCRNVVVIRNIFKKNVFIYKGNVFSKISFNKYNLGYKSGEFSITRKPFSYPLKKSKR